MSRPPRLRLSRLGASAYHVQQAAEKLIKALLVLAGEPFRRTHDLDDLAARLLPVYPQFARQAEAVRHLSIWGIAYRYPGLEDAPEPLPEIEELERMITMLTGIRRDGWPPHRRGMTGADWSARPGKARWSAR